MSWCIGMRLLVDGIPAPTILFGINIFQFHFFSFIFRESLHQLDLKSLDLDLGKMIQPIFIIDNRQVSSRQQSFEIEA